ncbi:hypothetical protein TNCV_3980321 [Trichonephila clavipes]|nr:hypothetical protein TNCV_3980321 [Trichonephila clavipes]
MSVSVAVRRLADSKGKVSVAQQLRWVLHASIVISEKRNNDGPVRVRKRYDCWNEVRWLLGDGNSHLFGACKEYCICRYNSIQEIRECDVWQAQQWTEKKAYRKG